MLERSYDSFELHEKFYKGPYPTVASLASNGDWEMADLPDLAKHQFEPILREDLKPLSRAEQELHLFANSTKGLLVNRKYTELTKSIY